MCNSIHKFYIICLLEKYLDSKFLPDNSNLEIPGYNLVSSDHPSNKKRGRVLYILQEMFTFKNYR